MFKKKECYLCGGKLINGRCSSCGLDNTKLDKKNYRLNESSFDRKKKMTYSQKRQNDTGETKNREKKKDAGHLCESHNGRKRTQTEYQQKENPRIEIPQTGQMQPGGPTVFNPARKVHTGSYEEQKKARKISGILAGIIVAIVAFTSIAGSVGDFISSFGDDFHSSDYDWNDNGSEVESEYDPYMNTTRELSETGATYDCVLGYGEYEIGAQIPEGTYEVELVSGEGSMQQDDPENSIYYYSYFSEDESDTDAGDYLDDVRLYTGGHLKINTGLVVQFHSENAQTEQMQLEENPLTEQVTLKAGNTYTAGTDFPAGWYDVTEASGVDWAELHYKIYLGDLYDKENENLNYENYGLWFYDTDGSESYKNAVFPEGTELEVDDGDLILTPSGSVKNQNYDSFYDMYRYRSQ